jgi:hypothetical protein
MKPFILCLLFLPVFSGGVYSQTATLNFKTEFDIPYKSETSAMNLTFDGVNFWISEQSTGDIYKINTNGIFLDTISGVKSTDIAFANGFFGIIRNGTDWFYKVNDKGDTVDSLKFEVPNAFKGAYQCRDICYVDSSLYSIWVYCYCGVCRLVKIDLKNKETIDLGDIPLCEKIVSINDTIWGNIRSELYSFYTGNSILNSFTKLTHGVSSVAGLVFENKTLWVLDQLNKKLKAFEYHYDISEIDDADELKPEYYPNPVISDLFISGIENIEYVKVVDVFGRLMLTLKPNQNGSFDISSLDKGVYFIKVYSGKLLLTGKIIKN